jgi:hypothetical protein
MTKLLGLEITEALQPYRQIPRLLPCQFLSLHHKDYVAVDRRIYSQASKMS